LSGLVAPSF